MYHKLHLCISLCRMQPVTAAKQMGEIVGPLAIICPALSSDRVKVILMTSFECHIMPESMPKAK